jgi:hypothetical protein
MECSDVMKLFIDNAKSYVQLSMGTLVFSVSFLRDVLREGESRLLKWSWTCFFFSIGCGTLYQYVAVRYCEKKPLVPHIDWLFGAMLIFFYTGASLFWFMAVRRIGQRNP